MAATLAAPAEPMRGRRSHGDDHPDADHDRLDGDRADRGPAREMARLLDGSVLSAITIGIAVAAAFSPSVRGRRDTWTFVTGGCFPAWPLAVLLKA
ncbi:MAG: hypothetical protein ABSA53_28735 [Streptosporangiaceae bacterium]|jgi:hypothetical protein